MTTNCKVMCNGNRICLLGTDVLPRIGEYLLINRVNYEVQSITHRFVGATNYHENPVEIIIDVRQITEG